MTKIKYVLPILAVIIGLVVLVSFRNGSENATKEKTVLSVKRFTEPTQTCYYLLARNTSMAASCPAVYTALNLQPFQTTDGTGATRPPTIAGISCTGAATYCCAVGFQIDQLELIEVSPGFFEWHPIANAVPCNDNLKRQTAPGA
jgi:hypothetical protein